MHKLFREDIILIRIDKNQVNEMSESQGIKKKNCTYADYISWSDDQRWEIIDGEAYCMNAPNTAHQRLSRKLTIQISKILDEKECELFYAPFDVLLPKGNESVDNIKTILQPDLLVICDKEKIKKNYCLGAPDWVVEILSPSTASRDQILKRRTYEKAGVKEYWVCHPTDFTVTIYRLENQKLVYQDTYDETAEPEVKAVPGLKVNLKDAFPERIKRVKEPSNYYRI